MNLHSNSSNSRSSNKAISVSAPGKVLLAGGYLVLERPNCAIVVATTSRFHSTIMTLPPLSQQESPTHCLTLDQQQDKDTSVYRRLPVDVYSPQFHSTFSYWLVLHHDDSDSSSNEQPQPQEAYLSLCPRNSPPLSSPPKVSNVFIEKTVLITMAFVLRHVGIDTFLHRFLSTSYPSDKTRTIPQQQELMITALAIQLRADNDFYSQIHYLQSQNMDLSLQNIESLDSFLPTYSAHNHDQSKPILHKTGLGSSAALVACLVSSILTYFGIIQLPYHHHHDHYHRPSLSMFADADIKSSTIELQKNHLKLCHNLAQLCHSLAQGKIGSGFDVSAAIYGTHVYTRFNEAVIAPIMDSIQKDVRTLTPPCPSSFYTNDTISLSIHTIQSIYECILYGKWDSIVEPFQLQSSKMELLLADVCGGSESPSMARKVLAWKKENHQQQQKTEYPTPSTEDEDPWYALIQTNQRIRHLFLSQSSTSLEEANVYPSSDSNKSHEYTKTYQENSILQEIRIHLLESRKYLKIMGILAGVDIEPDFQTRLANDCMNIHGVIAAGVPGAGGNDALYVLYSPECRDEEEVEKIPKRHDIVRENIVNFWSQWSREHKKAYGDEVTICPLTSKASGFGTTNGVCQTDLPW